MSRRDTIIVAVLINAGLLIVLFASALKSNGPGHELIAAPNPSVNETVALSAKKKTFTPPGDEVDQVLSQYANPDPVLPEAQPPAPAPVAASTFTDDFKFALPEPSVAPSSPTAPVISPVEKTAAETIDHKVKKGDVLEKIARHHHCTVDQIMKLNKLTATHLRIGQVLKIPTQPAVQAIASSTTTATQSVSTDHSPKYYTVKNGDNPWTIAVKNHIKVEELLKLNDLNEETARRLKPGDQLRIR